MTRLRAFAAALCLGFATLAFVAPAFAADKKALQERMTPEEFKAAGLDKLTPEELANLNTFLGRDTEKRAVELKEAEERAVAGFGGHITPNNEPIVSRLVGRFDGWEGKTVFRLENGQVWQQSDTGELAGVHMDAPMITITPSFSGAWWLSAEGRKSKVKVKRIK
jgi:hypothetical protein